MLPRKDSLSGGAIVRWDISLTLNMTKKSVIASRRRGNPTEKVRCIFSLWLWNISLALDTTRQKLFFLFIVFVGFAVDDVFICRHEFVRKI